MKLNKFDQRAVHKIQKPIWGGRKVGIATYKVAEHNEIRITATNKRNEPLYPLPFYISGKKLKKYPKEPVRSYPDVKVHVVPIEDLETLEIEEKDMRAIW